MATEVPQPPPRQSLTLARLVQVLGPSTVELLAAPLGAEVEVAGPCLYDPVDPGAIGRGDVVFGVNVRSGALASAIAAASTAGAAGVAFKGDPAALAEIAAAVSSEGIALIGVSADVTWDQLYELTRNAASAAGAALDENNKTPLGDLFAFSNALAAVIGGAVTIEGPRSNLLAYSNLDQPIDEPRRDTILGRRTPSNWAARLEEEDIPRRLMASPPKVVHIHDPRGEARDRLAISIWAGAQMLGTIWVVEGQKPLDDQARAALGETAPLAALHLLRHRSSEDLTRTERGAVLQALLEGRGSGAEIAASLGVDVTTPSAVVGFYMAVDDELEILLRRTRAADLIVMACEAFRRRVVCTAVGRTVYALFPSLHEGSTERLDVLVRDITTRAADSLGIRVVAGIGSTVPDLDGIQASREEADRVIRVLSQATKSERSVARIDRVRVESILLELGDVLRERPDLRLPELDLLEAYDRDHSKSYMQTLRAVIRASWDVPEAARNLNLHPNSLRYRLKRLEEISGLVLDDPRQRLLLSLQLLRA